ncbi:MAG: hypothetical protein ACO1TE_12560 [Prosthecobacter sp.]
MSTKTHLSETMTSNNETHGRPINRESFLRLITGALAGGLLNACAGIDPKAPPQYQLFQNAPCREYGAWAGVRPGTTKTFSGTSVYGGKSFNLGLTQKLVSVTSTQATVRISYAVDGTPSSKTETCHIPARGMASSTSLGDITRWMQATYGSFVLPSPTRLDEPQLLVLDTTDSYGGARFPVTFRPKCKTFSLSGRSYRCDCYEAKQINAENSEVDRLHRGLFCDQVPGGWVSGEFANKNTALTSDVNKTMFSKDPDITMLFYLGDRASLTLVSIA